MTYRIFFERVWYERKLQLTPQEHRLKNPFFLNPSQVQKDIAKARFTAENSDAVLFASNDEAKRQTFLFYTRLRNANRTLGDLFGNLPESARNKLYLALGVYCDFEVNSSTSLKGMSDEWL